MTSFIPPIPDYILQNYPMELPQIIANSTSLKDAAVAATSAIGDSVTAVSTALGKEIDMLDLWNKPLTQCVTYGALASTCVYVVWRSKLRGSSILPYVLFDIEEPDISPSSGNFDFEPHKLGTCSIPGSNCVGNFTNASHGDGASCLLADKTWPKNIFQQRLQEAECRLDDVRVELQQMESERKLLHSELQLHRNLSQRLQEEANSERAKRQDLELKLQMLEVETAQQKELRKELSEKSCQLNRLKNYLKNKEYIDKSPSKSSSPRRYHTLTDLHNRLQSLELMMSSFSQTNHQIRCQCSLSSMSIRQEPSSSVVVLNVDAAEKTDTSKSVSPVKEIIEDTDIHLPTNEETLPEPLPIEAKTSLMLDKSPQESKKKREVDGSSIITQLRSLISSYSKELAQTSPPRRLAPGSASEQLSGSHSSTFLSASGGSSPSYDIDSPCQSSPTQVPSEIYAGSLNQILLPGVPLEKTPESPVAASNQDKNKQSCVSLAKKKHGHQKQKDHGSHNNAVVFFKKSQNTEHVEIQNNMKDDSVRGHLLNSQGSKCILEDYSCNRNVSEFDLVDEPWVMIAPSMNTK